MKVYRLEHKTLHWGPFCIDEHPMFRYKSERFQKRVNAVLYDIALKVNLRVHPAPQVDFPEVAAKYGPDDIMKEFFGCRSVEHIHDWFGHKFTDLHKLNFVIRCYDVKDEHVHIGKSGNQVCFNRRKSKLINTMELLS